MAPVNFEFSVKLGFCLWNSIFVNFLGTLTIDYLHLQIWILNNFFLFSAPKKANKINQNKINLEHDSVFDLSSRILKFLKTHQDKQKNK